MMLNFSCSHLFLWFILTVKNEPTGSTTYTDPAMIGVLVGMALMFIILCVVLRLFSK